MSGGVDSSVAMILLKKRGFIPIGVSLKYDVWRDPENELNENVCCSAESFEIAKHVCEKMGVKHYILNAGKKFNKEVVDYFKSELRTKRTPNPCVVCNRKLKFVELINFAKKHKIPYVATGHYVRIRKNSRTKKYELLKGIDEKKDQTYSLSFLKKEWLKNLIFPLGDYTKDQVYKIAKKEGFDFYEKQKQSQDFCFIGKKAMQRFLKKEIGEEKGEVVNAKDQKLGTHEGLHFYTVGQRKNLNIPNGPYYVTDFNVPENKLIVTKNEKDKSLYKSELYLKPYNLLTDKFTKPIKVEAKIRYQQPESKAVLCPEKNGFLKLIFTKPQRAVTLGQYAVFYKNDVCLGGGRILKT